MSNKRKTGLGTDAFFQQPAAAEENQPVEREDAGQKQAARPEATQQAKSKPEKVRTTVTLYPETLAGMEMLKVQARLEGEKATYSDILNEAIQNLMEKKGVKFPS